MQKGQEPQFKVAIHDEPDEAPLVIPVARYKIEDEPEEVFAKQPLPPVKVEIKDEPGDNAPLHRADRADPAGALSGLRTADGVRHRLHRGRRCRANKLLTFSRNGSTNSTMVSVSGGKGRVRRL